jgi:hypothetical protein
MYLFIRGSTNPGPRVTRIIDYFSLRKKRIVYLAPYRKGDLPSPNYRDLGGLGEYDYFDGSGIFSYLCFILKVNWLIAKIIFIRRKEIEFVHFSDLEVVLLGGIVCRFLGIRFVYNIHDNYFQRYDVGRFMAAVLKYFESIYIFLSNKTLVPEVFRKECYPRFLQGKIFVLRNYPAFDVSTSHIPFNGNVITLFYGGWVSENRSIGYFFDLAAGLIENGYLVQFNLCGWGNRPYIDRLSESFAELGVSFNYLGQLSQVEAVSHLKEADISIAYYSPDRVINIFAASNKIPEIIGSSTILVTNEQTEIAKKILPYNISLQFDSLVSEIMEELLLLIRDKHLTTKFVSRASKFYMDEYNPQKLANEMEKIFCEYN